MADLQDIENLNGIISQNLKALRKERNLTLEDVSRVSGVSKSMLGQIERGESSPSVATLWKIATGLKISFTSLLLQSKQEVQVVENRAVPPLTNDTDSFSLYPVFPFAPGRNFEILHIELAAGAKSVSTPHDPGTEEFILVYAGTLTLHLENKAYTVPAGHSIHYKADQAHTYENCASETIQLCMVIYYA